MIQFLIPPFFHDNLSNGCYATVTLTQGESMKRLAIVCGIALSFLAVSARADEMTMTGTLIDQKCGAKMMKKDDAQAAVDKHDKACTAKCGKTAGYALVNDGKETKLAASGNEKINEYLAKDDSTTKVSIKGEMKDDEMTVMSIEPAK
jgi:hypothetical protein